MWSTALLAAALLAGAATPSSAQIETQSQPEAPLRFRGVSVGMAGGEVITTSFRWTRLGSRGFGFDGAVTTAPQLLPHGAVALMVSLGPTASVPFDGGALMAKAGASPVIIGGGGSGGALIALYYGAALILAAQGSIGLRIDWTRHHGQAKPGDGVGIVELGFSKSIR